LAAISVAHLYNLRKSQRYRERLPNHVKTRPTAVSIGERRKPQPEGQPGYLRLDTVHQGDRPEGGGKGVYHINAADEVTQWEVAGATPRISEAYLEPVLKHMMRQFPFRILGLHTDNGSEFINKTVAGLLNKLLIEQTKSRPRQSGDNGLVETKNGAVIRKHIGHGYIDAAHADRINGFYREYLNPYLNLSSSLRPGRREDRREGPQTRSLQAISNPARDSFALGQSGTIPARWTEHERAEKGRRSHRRYRRGAAHAGSKKQAVREIAAYRVGPGAGKEGRGNGGLWKARKTVVLFSALPTGLGNRSKTGSENEDRAERFPHSLRPATNC